MQNENRQKQIGTREIADKLQSQRNRAEMYLKIRAKPGPSWVVPSFKHHAQTS
jgi:hypothetical protein